VLGAHREAILKTIDFRSATVLVNDNWDEGLASSIRTGVKEMDSIASGVAGVLLMTCDQPRVTARHLRILIEKSEDQPTTMVASVYARTRGTPAVFPRVMFADLLALRGDKGARGLLGQGLSVVEVLLDGGEIDIDQPEDLAETM
jgi:CTP:molybdopterin cytidylyltransferase MocA